MRKYLAFFGLIFFNVTHAQTSVTITDSLAADSSIIFAPTPAGIPNGEKSAKIIDKQGGSLASSDNKIELIIPAGVFNSKTQVKRLKD